jgi:hypothetical protein
MGVSIVTPAWLTRIISKLWQNHLWQRVLKHTIAVTIALIIVIIPAVNARYGSLTFLAPLTTVFGHAGQRFGQMAESLILILLGSLIGLGWSILALYLSDLVFNTNQPAAYTIKAVFTLVATVFHGYLRSHSPRLFVMVWFVLVVCFTLLLGSSTGATASTATQCLYPILTAMGVLLIVNVTVFPEFSGRALGETTIKTLNQTKTALESAVDWFMDPGYEAEDIDKNTMTEAELHGHHSARHMAKAMQVSKLAGLTTQKAQLRGALRNCKKAYEECTFEIMYSVLPPRNLKPISTTAMSGIVQNTITLINACESKFVMIDHDHDGPDDDSMDDESGSESSPGHTSGDHSPKLKKEMSKQSQVSVDEQLKEFKAKREIASGDAEILKHLVAGVRKPVVELSTQVSHAIDLVMICLAYCYDVERLPSGSRPPQGISLEELDLRADMFETAIAFFDTNSMNALRDAAVHHGDGEVSFPNMIILCCLPTTYSSLPQIEIMPRIETFLMSSCILSLRQAAEQVRQMLQRTKVLVERRKARHDRKRVYLPRKIQWRKWLLSGGERDAMTLPQVARKDVRTGKVTEQGASRSPGDASDDEDTVLPQPTIRMNTLLSPKDEEAPPLPASNISPPQRTKTSERRIKPPNPDGDTPLGLRLRGKLADIVEFFQHSEHVGYALKMAVAVFSISWIAFYGPWNAWYTSAKAGWAPLQLILVFEVVIGSSFWVFVVRATGVLFGCLSGFLAFEIGQGNLFVLVILLIFAILPSAYVQIGTPYVKAGMISIVSMTVVAIGVYLPP